MPIERIENNLTNCPEDRNPVAVGWQYCAYRLIFCHPAFVLLHPSMEPIVIDESCRNLRRFIEVDWTTAFFDDASENESKLLALSFKWVLLLNGLSVYPLCFAILHVSFLVHFSKMIIAQSVV